MAKQETTPKFPENAVDNLIADFGRKPSSDEMDKTKALIESQRPKFKAVDKALESTKSQDQSNEMNRGR